MNRISLFLLSGWLACGCLGALAGPQQPDEPQAEADDSAPEVQQKARRQRDRAPAQDQVVLGGDLVVKPDQEIAEGVVIGGAATIDGKVNRNLVVILGHAKLGAGANVRGNLVVVAGSADIHPDARVRGERVILGLGSKSPLPAWLGWPRDWVTKGLLWGRPLPHQVAWSWAFAGLFLALYLLAAVLFPRPVQASVDALSSRPGTSFLCGLLAMMLFGPLVVLLTFTVVGIVLLPFLGCGFIAAFIFGKVTVYRYAGEQFGGQTGLELLQKPLVALLIGVLLFYLLYTIPVLGMVVWCAVAPLGLGAVLLAFTRRVRSEEVHQRNAVPPVCPMPPPVAGLGPPPLPEAVAALGLPRAGFWLRLAATLLDFLLVWMVTHLVRAHGARLFILVWAAYHVALWSWRSTTIGGVICGLKIVRTDGQPIDLPIALVRCLSAFLSAAALFLGFFWAGWTADKQSWHDKIAGTCIVKMPKGVPLL